MPGDAAEGPPQRVWLVRHGEGTHNATGRGGVLDPPLTPAGEEQAAALRGHPELQRCELLVVSPLRRAVQTAVAAFGERPRCRAVLSALCCERWASRCDEGRPKAQLLESFPFLRGWGGTEALPEQWTPTQATDADWLTRRVPAFLSWLREQPERQVVVVGHGAYFMGLLGWHMQNCEVAELVDVGALVRTLRSARPPQDRRDAAAALGRSGKAALPWAREVEGLLTDPDAAIRGNAAKALGKIAEAAASGGGAPCAEALAGGVARLLGDAEASVRAAAAEALGDAGEPAAAHAAAASGLLGDPSPEVRQNAAFALGRMLKTERPGLGISVGEDGCKRRRTHLTQREAVEPIARRVARLLADPDDDCKYWAVEALGYLGEVSRPFLQEVAALLGSDDPETKQTAAWAVGQIGGVPAAVAARLAQLLAGDQPAGPRWFATEALGELGDVGKPFAGEIARLLQDPSAELRAVAARALGQLCAGSPGRASELAPLLRDSDASVQEGAAEALGRMGEAAAAHADAVRRLLDGDDVDLVATAQKALGRMLGTPSCPAAPAAAAGPEGPAGPG